jgi:hypothetical protein
VDPVKSDGHIRVDATKAEIAAVGLRERDRHPPMLLQRLAQLALRFTSPI